jgi:hypothetical protein
MALTLLTVSASRADACTCGRVRSTCEVLWQAGAVFAATDEAGRFSVAVIAGRSYGVFAQLPFGLLGESTQAAEVLVSADSPALTITLPIQKLVKN